MTVTTVTKALIKMRSRASSTKPDPGEDRLSSYIIFPPYFACLVFLRTTRRVEPVAFFCRVEVTAFADFVFPVCSWVDMCPLPPLASSVVVTGYRGVIFVRPSYIRCREIVCRGYKQLPCTRKRLPR